MDRPLLVVDSANVVGMVPDGWWRRRAEATELLRDALEPLADTGIAGRDLPADLAWLAGPALEGVPVGGRSTRHHCRSLGAIAGQPGPEGAALRAGSLSVRVVPARGSGDDAIVNLVAEEGGGRRTAVATGDRALQSRVARLGASVLPPTALPLRARLPGDRASRNRRG